MQFTKVSFNHTKSRISGDRTSVLMNTLEKGLKGSSQAGKFAAKKAARTTKDAAKGAGKFIKKVSQKANVKGSVAGAQDKIVLDAVDKKVVDTNRSVCSENEKRRGISTNVKSIIQRTGSSELSIISYRSEPTNEDLKSLEDGESAQRGTRTKSSKKELIILSARSSPEEIIGDQVTVEKDAKTWKKELVIISARSTPEQQLVLFQGSSNNQPKEPIFSFRKISKAISKIKKPIKIGKTICSQGIGMKGLPGKVMLDDLFMSHADFLNKTKK